MTPIMSLKVAVVGAGLSGKAMAIALDRYQQAADSHLQVCLIDQGAIDDDMANDGPEGNEATEKGEVSGDADNKRARQRPAGVYDSADQAFLLADTRTYSLTPASVRYLDALAYSTHNDQILSRETGPLNPYKNIEVWDKASGSTICFKSENARLPYLGAMVEHRHLNRYLTRQLQDSQVVRMPHTKLVGFNYEALEQERISEVEGFASQNSARPAGIERFEKARRGAGTTKPVALTLLQTAREIVETFDLVIACDGSESQVRELAEIESRDKDYEQSAIVCNVLAELTHNRQTPTALQVFAQTGPCAMLPLKLFDGEKASDTKQGLFNIVWSHDNVSDDGSVESLMNCSDTEFLTSLNRLVQDESLVFTAVSKRHAVPLKKVVAKHMSANGLALVGDAAHFIHPLAGQGINLGFADVAALMQALQNTPGVQQGLNLHQALNRYARARSLHNKGTAGAMDLFYAGFKLDSPLSRYVRAKGMNRFAASNMLKRMMTTLVSR